MNCPHCRKKLWYISGLSKPPDLKTYVCTRCSKLLGFVPLTFKAGTTLYGGYRIVEGVVRKTGYTPPPVMKRGPAKEAPSTPERKVARAAQKGPGEFGPYGN